MIRRPPAYLSTIMCGDALPEKEKNMIQSGLSGFQKEREKR
jgi:hypothetical protein